MDEFMPGDDWDLDAVVRGYMSQASSASCDAMDCFGSFIEDDDPLMRSLFGDPGFPFDFPEFSEKMATVLDDLEGLIEPAVLPPAASQAIAVAGSSGDAHVEMNVNEVAEKLQDDTGSAAVATSSADVDAVHATSKYKRRKNQHKQVVQHVTADGVSSDLWAWRKYGQKPIKGSPFPRSYYRCSSSKGCLARKQVERSSSEPGMFIVTYTGEHSHTQPTRRSALAGITRPSKFSTPKKPAGAATTKGGFTRVPKLPREASNTDQHVDRSPTSTTTVEEYSPHKPETLGWSESEIGDGKTVNLPSLSLGEEMFMGFGELEGLGLGMDFALTDC